MSRGRLIAFEGGEASGKTTQAELLADAIGAVMTFEPGATRLGTAARDLLLHSGLDLDPRAETLLLLADRAQHVAEVVRPLLDRGHHVVTDRFVGSTLAYQGFGRGLDVDQLRSLSEWATAGLAPDLVVLLDVPAEVAAARRAGTSPDRFEAEDGAFHRRVADGYCRLAEADPARWVVVDGDGDVDEVAARVRVAVFGVVDR